MEKTKPKTHAVKSAAKPVHKEAKPSGRYFEGIGRRKTAIARVRIMIGKGDVSVGEKSMAQYFAHPRLQEIIKSPFEKLKLGEKFDVTAQVQGGGIHAQAEAVRLGIARALVEKDSELKKRLRAYGFMTRDPRMVERKKPGLKKARRAPQWAKR